MSVPNPYTPMLLTYHPSRFYGRENEIISILQVITAIDPGGHAIYGIRTIGKTTLLKYLKDPGGALKKYAGFVNVEYRPNGTGDKQLLFIYISFHNFSSEERLFYVMLTQLEEELENEDLSTLVQIPVYDDRSERQELVNILRRTLQRLNNQGIRVVFLFDDFDEPLKTLDTYDDGLLRTLSDYAALIIITEAPISELRPDFGQSSPLLGILRPEAIGLLSETAARELIRDPLKSNTLSFKIEEEDLLLQVAGRQPFLLTAACELYFDIRQEYDELIDGNAPDYAARQAQFIHRLSGQPHVMRVLQSTWDRLKPEEHRTLYAIYTGSKIDLTGERGSLAARLEKKGLIYWDARLSLYRIFSILFGEFVQRLYDEIDARTLPAPAPATARSIPESLTPIDSALLRYLSAHPDRVCTFDELLDAVWEDGEKSKRALEAAVHRLRRALDPDEQIKNVRGIGYKFVKTPSYQNIP